MSESTTVHKDSLECLHLAETSSNIARDILTPDHLRAHFIRMANMWFELAVPLPTECELSSPFKE